ncbi:Glycosyl hydrolase family 47 [Madurella fahalii]|uniref:alpha-1,2-Mannosidase n=1 Tax=Madurella fahalii TaxID=1157608 RepID=A0ABQ0FZU7_9PEZI
MATLTGRRRFQRLAIVTTFFLVAYLLLGRKGSSGRQTGWRDWEYIPSSFDWGRRPQAYPVDGSKRVRLPEGIPRQLPRIQHEFSRDELSDSHNTTQRERRKAVRRVAKRSWKAYRDHAWGQDEVVPLRLVGRDTFAGWGATLVDSLDTLWIMGMKEDFYDAVRHVATIDWNNSTFQDCSLFETNIRYLGGLLSAYDLSQERILLDKAVELGDMLHAGFDTPNHMPANTFHFELAKEGKLAAGKNVASAAVGSLSLEFTRLSQLTGNPKYYSAIDGVTKAFEETQDSTNLPGLWPVFVDLSSGFGVRGTVFSLGSSADSAYEYLSKMHALLGGLEPTYEKLHTKAMAAARKHLLFRPMLPDLPPATTPDILFLGNVLSNGMTSMLQPEVQHLGCFAGGMFALGGRLFGQEDDVGIGERLARGCAWAYQSFPTGIMPELSDIVPCEKKKKNKDEDDLAPCKWNETRWEEQWAHVSRFPKPFKMIRDPQYLLRPEAIESIFILYRITGKADLLDIAWHMFQSIKDATETKFAYSSIADVQVTKRTTKLNRMESYWIAETLKYFYLIFSEPELISLDDYVLNTEAHPLKLPKPGDGTMRGK